MLLNVINDPLPSSALWTVTFTSFKLGQWLLIINDFLQLVTLLQLKEQTGFLTINYLDVHNWCKAPGERCIDLEVAKADQVVTEGKVLLVVLRRGAWHLAALFVFYRQLLSWRCHRSCRVWLLPRAAGFLEEGAPLNHLWLCWCACLSGMEDFYSIPHAQVSCVNTSVLVLVFYAVAVWSGENISIGVTSVDLLTVSAVFQQKTRWGWSSFAVLDAVYCMLPLL